MSESQEQQETQQDPYLQKQPLVVKEKDYQFYSKQRKIQSQKTDKNYLLLEEYQLRHLRTMQKKKINFNKALNETKQNRFGGGGKKQISLGAQKLIANASKRGPGLKGSKVDPLGALGGGMKVSTKKNPLAGPGKSNDPLSKKPRADPLAKKNPLASQPKKEQQDPLVDTNEQNPDELIKQMKRQDIKAIIDNEEKQDDAPKDLNDAVYWKEVRLDFVKIFGIKTSSSKMNQLVVNPFGQDVIKNEDRQFMRQAQSGQNKIEYGVQPQTNTRELQKITVKNYLILLEEKFSKMKNKWDEGDKVSALQVTIQQIKLLVENENPRFAPIKFVYVIDILEKFGRNVFHRMKKLSFPNKSEDEIFKLPFSQISGANISEQTQEIARNWLKKIGSIRELLPRMYVEAALLPIHFFLDASAIMPIIKRLTRMTRAIGDYINCIYFSTYFLRICVELVPKEKSYILEIIKDFLFYMKQGPKFFGKQNMSGEEYFELFCPFLDTAFRYYSNNCSDVEFYDLFQTFQNSNQHQEVLKRIITNFPTSYIAQYAAGIFGIIQNYHVDVKASVYTLFLPKISQTVSNKTVLGQICQLVWLDLVQVTNLSLFLNILASLIELVQKAFQGFQKTKFFHDILDKFNELLHKDKKALIEQKLQDVTHEVSKEILEKLEEFLYEILKGADNVSELITIEPFTQFIQFFPSEQRSQVSVNVLKIFLQKDEESEKISNPVTVHSLLQITLNINQVLVLNEEQTLALKQILKRILKKVDFGKDLEQMLNLYTDVRQNFGNISEVTEDLIYRVIDLTFLARKLSKNKVSKKLRAFFQACIAFCYITIPMVQNIQVQLQFYNTCAQVALLHNLISQSEAIFKSGLQVLLELPEQLEGKNLDVLLQPIMKNMLGFMVVVPDDPEYDYLHLFIGFYKLIDVFKWSKKNGELYKLSLLSDFIKYLGVQIQDRLPYHVDGVISNDQLFAEADFKEKIVDYLQQALIDIVQTQRDILTRQNLAQDLYTNVGIVKQNLELINTLLQYLRPNNTIKHIIENALAIIDSRGQMLINDKIGKLHFKGTSSYIQNTLANLEKSGEEIPNYSISKDKILRSVEYAKSSGF